MVRRTRSGERHAEWFLSVTAFPSATPMIQAMNDAALLERLTVEQENLRAALHWFATRGDAESLLRLTGSA